eukprot:TRINITY_DN3703_c0_g1_i6.p1 TRINITY_DN3703_c0_g1~~TRINITY_DN3703_c0_g1_i6.p1  ORF type:complete len:712 (-),score=141.07 TRINITY_DN3703_c0_g1_i6:16-2151(-)
MNSLDCVNVVVLGDRGSGKTSLVTCLIRGPSQTKVPPRVPPVLLKGEQVQTKIIDTSSKPVDQQQVDKEIVQAHFICIVYDMNLAGSQKVSGIVNWIRRVENLVTGLPLALVGTKSDLRKEKSDLEQEMKTIMSQYDQVEYVMECSALDPNSKKELEHLFNLAQHTVLYPRMPLCDTKLNFRPRFVSVLKRIFQIVDSDKDGFLDVEELKSLQCSCFSEELEESYVLEIMETIKRFNPKGVSSKGLNETGFLSLFHLIMQRGRTETIWTLLRYYGYDNSLKISTNFLNPHFHVPQGHVLELSSQGTRWLREIFLQYGRANSEQVLTWHQIDKMFSVVPDGEGHPWQTYCFPRCCATSATARTVDDASTTTTSSTYSYDSTSTVDIGMHSVEEDPVTLKGFIAMWNLTTLLDPSTAIRYMYYLGYQGKRDRTDCFTVTKERSTFFVYVIGPPGSGKSSLIRAFLGKDFKLEDDVENNKRSFVGVNAFEIEGQDKTYHLVLNEPPQSLILPLLSSADYADKMNMAQLVILVYDPCDPKGFLKLTEMFNMLDKKYRHVPCILASTKADHPNSLKHMSPKTFCEKHGLREPIRISAKNKTGLERLFTLAIETIKEKKQRKPRPSLLEQGWFGTISITVVVCFALFKYYNSSLLMLEMFPHRWFFPSRTSTGTLTNSSVSSNSSNSNSDDSTLSVPLHKLFASLLTQIQQFLPSTR